MGSSSGLVSKGRQNSVWARGCPGRSWRKKGLGSRREGYRAWERGADRGPVPRDVRGGGAGVGGGGVVAREWFMRQCRHPGLKGQRFVREGRQEGVEWVGR